MRAESGHDRRKEDRGNGVSIMTCKLPRPDGNKKLPFSLTHALPSLLSYLSALNPHRYLLRNPSLPAQEPIATCSGTHRYLLRTPSLPAQNPIATCSEPHRYLLTTLSSPFTLLTRHETRSLSHCDVKTKPIRKTIPLTKPPVVKARPRLTFVGF